MEEDQQNLRLEDNQLILKHLLIKTDEEVKDGASSSNEEKKTEESKDASGSPQKEENRKTPTPTRSSPEPSCAICLEQLQNKSFTDSCFHMFCFTCLVEWSRVKPECPLCKQSFKSIVHNVRSFQEYDQYYINKSRPPDMFACDRRFRYNTTMTPDRLFERNLPDSFRADYSDRIESEMASHRMRYAPHSVHSVRMYATTSSSMRRTIPCIFRRRIYDENLWVTPASRERVRCASPAFFRRNIACTHRLLPWLNRELLVVMPNNEGQIAFVIELIMALIVKYNITSQEFFTHIEPYTAPHTSHFIHEFYNFAISPFDMENYDHYAQYSSMPCEPVQLISSPDSDVIPLPMNESATPKSTNDSKRKKKHSSRKKNMSEYKRRLVKLVLKRNSESNRWETVMSSVLNCSEVSSSNPFEVPGPSTSRDTAFPECSPEVSNQELEKSNDVECLEADEECQIVQILKPKGERTPEIVDLSSDEELEKTVNVSSSKEDDDLNEIEPGTFSDIIDMPPISTYVDDDDSDDDIVFLSENVKDNNVADKPIDYSLKTNDRDVEIVTENSVEVEVSASGSKDNVESEQVKEDPPVVHSVVKNVTNEDTGSSSWSPLLKPKKRRATILDDSSTESCSESTPDLDSQVKKLKLRSVVAHFLFDPSDERNDSSHHSSSHKKHKEKKKKKKKHKRKRIYSSDSN